MTNRFPIALAAVLLLTACNKPAATPLASTDNAAAAPAGTSAGLPDDLQTAVAVSQAMKRYPAKGDSVLTAFHLTANDFAALMKRIAADSAMSAQYRQLTQ